jgi:hypothetical protein
MKKTLMKWTLLAAVAVGAVASTASAAWVDSPWEWVSDTQQYVFSQDASDTVIFAVHYAPGVNPTGTTSVNITTTTRHQAQSYCVHSITWAPLTKTAPLSVGTCLYDHSNTPPCDTGYVMWFGRARVSDSH